MTKTERENLGDRRSCDTCRYDNFTPESNEVCFQCAWASMWEAMTPRQAELEQEAGE